MRSICVLIVALSALLGACSQQPETRPDSAPATAVQPIPTGKLGDAIQPLRYRVALEVFPERDDFSGQTSIDVIINKASDTFYLHGNGLTVSSVSVRMASGKRLNARYEQVDDTGVARLSFPATVPPGPATLEFTYTAPFRNGSEGLYHTTVAGEAYAFTQFEPIDARRVFPGFDEPAFKTPFDISVTTTQRNTVIGNAPVRSESLLSAGLKRVEFKTTKPLPTYLIALAVGPLDVVEWTDLPANAVRDRPLPLRGVATAGKGEQLQFALENTDPIVRYLENYFAVEYPYAKLDLVASPEMGTGAMENAGAIMYGDAAILMAANASAEQRRRFGSVHAHELAHQWFGNLVTPKWWDDTWLNESFASWMGFKAAAAWRPEYQLDVITLVQALAAMDLDSRIAARQIRQPVDNNLQIASSFDAITYLKGGGVLSMFESYLGEEGFRNGLRKHMQRFRFSVADVEDFMESLAMGSGRPDVVPAFRSFIDQPGVPLADVSVSCNASGATLSVAQSRYLPIGSKGNPDQLWKLPLCVRYDDNGKLAKECTLVSSAQARLDLSHKGCPDFVMPNADGAGYYRFALTDDGWAALMNNFQRLNQKEALSAADSLSAAYQADRLSTTALFDGITRIAASEYPQVAMAPKSDLILLSDKIVSDSVRPALQTYMRAIYRPRLDELDSADLKNISEAKKIERALFRTSLVEFLALHADDQELRARLADQARRYIRMDAGEDDAGLDESAVAPALTAIALKAGVLELGSPFAEVLIRRLVASDDAKFRAEAAAALGNTDDPVLGARVRELLLDKRLRAREPTTLAFELASRPSQRRATFDWFKANHEAFIGRLSHFAYRWLPRLGAGFCSIEDRNEVESFFRPLVANMQGADRTLAEVVEGIELCAALKDAKADEIAAWLIKGR